MTTPANTTSVASEATNPTLPPIPPLRHPDEIVIIPSEVYTQYIHHHHFTTITSPQQSLFNIHSFILDSVFIGWNVETFDIVGAVDTFILLLSLLFLSVCLSLSLSLYLPLFLYLYFITPPPVSPVRLHFISRIDSSDCI